MTTELRLTARVAPYLDAIREKRAGGWRWRDIRAALAIDSSDRALAQAVRRCKWKAEQLPLPDLSMRTKPQAQIKPQAPAATATAMRPLPTAGGNKLIEDEDERRKMLAERGIVFK